MTGGSPTCTETSVRQRKRSGVPSRRSVPATSPPGRHHHHRRAHRCDRRSRRLHHPRRLTIDFQGLDTPCGTCHRRAGDHTLDEYAACAGTPAVDLPYESVPGGPIPLTLNGGEVTWADHLTARSVIVEAHGMGGVAVRAPAVIFTFQVGSSVSAPTDVTEVAYVGTPETMRQLGRILRDTCNGAANAAERIA